jgi:Tol biopolymer transport system component
MTPGYSPPEQYGTARTDPRTDIYSLGATLYAALSGIIPEDGLARAMDNTQLTPLRKRNSKVSRRLAAAIEKAMGIDPADRFQNADEFKRALLGSKSKTQRLPGDYIVASAPAEDQHEQSAIERASQPFEAAKSNSKASKEAQKEAPVFKPRRKKRNGRKLLTAVLLTVFLLTTAMVAVVRFRPDLVPPMAMNVLSPISSIPIPFLAATNTAISLPLPSATPTTVIFDTPTLTATADPPTPTHTVAPTFTSTPVVEVSVTADNTPIAQATLLGGGFGQIAFASAASGIPQINLINVDGTNQVALTTISSGACQPTWSPDGSRLVFISPCRVRGEFFETRYMDSSLYVMNADGTDVKQLTNVPGGDFDPAWSPDGSRVAFTSLRDGNKQIYSLDVNSLSTRRLTTYDVNVENSLPAWSPFGDQIVYLAKRLGTYQVWMMTDTGQKNSALVGSGQTLWDFAPTWSRDGRVILFSQRRSSGFSPAWLMSLQYTDGTNATRLNLPVPIEDVEYSPDGLWLVSEGRDGGGNRDIYFMTITGGSRTRLTTDPGDDFDPTWRPVQNPNN